MTASILSTIAGALLSLLFSYVPGAREWFDGLGKGPDGQEDGGTLKRLVMLGLLVVAAGGAMALACSGVGGDLGQALTCDRPGAIELVQALAMAVMANQSTYAISPKLRSRRGSSGARR